MVCSVIDFMTPYPTLLIITDTGISSNYAVSCLKKVGGSSVHLAISEAIVRTYTL
jgi:hypothetical protein